MKILLLKHILHSLMISGFLIISSSNLEAAKPTTAPGQSKKDDSSSETTTTTTKKTPETTTEAPQTTTSEKTTGKPADITIVTGSADPNSPTVYHFESDFSLKNNVKIEGYAKIVADGGFDFKNSEIQIGENSSLTMYVQGAVKLAGNGEINTLASPASFMVYGTGGEGQTIDIVGNSGLSGVIYAPDASFTIKGTAGMLGAVIANKISNNGQGSTTKSFNGLNYDEALKDMAIGEDTLTMEDYGIYHANDHINGDSSNSTYAEFFSQF